MGTSSISSSGKGWSSSENSYGAVSLITCRRAFPAIQSFSRLTISLIKGISKEGLYPRKNPTGFLSCKTQQTVDISSESAVSTSNVSCTYPEKQVSWDAFSTKILECRYSLYLDLQRYEKKICT
ncbi:hypothetical protein RvY_05753 [Ramazzottius varieornatus]|uniref:Uncharacterized protein n=1 Tax=Ramazzottius varieornatus TaxID=947166 RepID=A0A1D1V2S3_RAMVA|nr:hypothetical protein RvY_05753 [Ramazzottius varieornatus]